MSKYDNVLSLEEIEIAVNSQKIVSTLSQDIGDRNYKNYSNLEASSDFITREFESLGYVIEIMPYEVDGQIFKNITAEHPNNDSVKETFIVGAHYDTCFNPGADDNATGVAGIIELARLLKDEKFKYNLKFVAFTNEEPPFFNTQNMGSFVYASRVKEAGEKIKGAIVLEMIGYFSEKPFSQKYVPLLGPFFPNKGNFVLIVGNSNSKMLVKNLYSEFRLSERFPVERIVAPDFIPGVDFSDHASFWKFGIPAVMVTDTAYLRNHNYHKQTDLPNTLDFNKMAKVIYGLKHAILGLDMDKK